MSCFFETRTKDSKKISFDKINSRLFYAQTIGLSIILTKVLSYKYKIKKFCSFIIKKTYNKLPVLIFAIITSVYISVVCTFECPNNLLVVQISPPAVKVIVAKVCRLVWNVITYLMPARFAMCFKALSEQPNVGTSGNTLSSRLHPIQSGIQFFLSECQAERRLGAESSTQKEYVWLLRSLYFECLQRRSALSPWRKPIKEHKCLFGGRASSRNISQCFHFINGQIFSFAGCFPDFLPYIHNQEWDFQV